MQQDKGGEQKFYRLLGLFNLLVFFLFAPSLWGSFEDFKHKQNQSFAKYKDERDAAFDKFLKQQWEAYKAQAPEQMYAKPKPKSITPSPPTAFTPVGPMVRIELEQLPLTPLDTPKEKLLQNDLVFNFFGIDVGFAIDESIKKAKFYPHSQVGVSNFFTTAAQSQHEHLLKSIQTYSQNLELNDWGVYLLTKELSLRVYKGEDEAKLLTWFLLSKLGYNVKVGIANGHVEVLHHSKKIIYATPSYTFDGEKFYLLADYAKKNLKKIHSYKQDYPNATKPLDLALGTLPKIGQSSKEKELKFSQKSKEYRVSFTYNQHLIDFMASYPQADYDTFFNAPLEHQTYDTVAKGLKAHIDGKQASEALNFILHFVQSAFIYERDDEQFGREKVMFAQETLVYDKSDCEDRAVLYAYLVKKLLKIGVIGIKYSDHMATALYIPPMGDTLNLANRKFVVADPTYVNANIGQSMPKYKSKMPQSFIVVRKDAS